MRDANYLTRSRWCSTPQEELIILAQGQQCLSKKRRPKTGVVLLVDKQARAQVNPFQRLVSGKLLQLIVREVLEVDIARCGARDKGESFMRSRLGYMDRL